MKRMIRFFEAERDLTKIVYSGDDENDARAMRWLVSKGSKAIIVGGRVSVPGAIVVLQPADLPAAVKEVKIRQNSRALCESAG